VIKVNSFLISRYCFSQRWIWNSPSAWGRLGKGSAIDQDLGAPGKSHDLIMGEITPQFRDQSIGGHHDLPQGIQVLGRD
jgi:hypothetical protein